MRVEKNCKAKIEASIYGGKNYWTSALFNFGFEVPKSMYFSAVSYEECLAYVESEQFLLDVKDVFNEDALLCVRSSAVLEDGGEKSGAGKYKSVIGVKFNELKNAFLQVSGSGSNKKERIGILLQQMVNPSYSGVIFSSNPLTKNRDEIVINYVPGFGEKLMSGETSGTSLLLNAKNLELEDNEIKEQLLEVISAAEKLEKQLGFPVDVEWCIEKNTNKVIIVQCRPVTNVLYERNEFIKIDKDCLKYGDIKNNEKVALRLVGLENDIYVSPAYLLRVNCLEQTFPDIDISFTPTEMTTGYSVVVISPKVINGEVMRAFSGINKNHSYKCNRYGVRLSPGSYKELLSCIKEMYLKLKDIVWSFTLIIQEVFDPYMTGIIKKSNNGFIMEVLRGHFAAKGVFQMSKYACDESFNIIYRDEVYQDNYYLIIDGNKVLLPNEDENKLVSLSDNLVQETFKKIAPLFIKPGLNVEFGLLKNNNGYLPYLIDYTVENEACVDLKNISNGVISSGKVTGKLIRVESGDPVGAIDAHFHNKIQRKTIKQDNVIYACDLPTISLLKLLEESGDNIGFVFKEGSSLCHFAVTLREKNIPAIVGVDINTLDYESVYTLNTDIEGSIEDKLYK